MKSTFSPKGTGVALITPFTKKGAIDREALQRVVQHCRKGGIDYLVLFGTTGESVTLTAEEKVQVVSWVREASGKMPLVYGLGGNNTAALVQEVKHVDAQIFSAILSVSPYYNKPSQEGIYRHYAAVAQASALPIILYNVPGRTSSNLTAHTTLRLAKDFKNIIAIKEASGNMEQSMHILAGKPERFEVLSGDDNLTLPLMACGATGVISVAAMARPAAFSKMVNLCLKGKFAEAGSLHYRIMPITDLLFSEGNPTGIKAALSIMGLCTTAVRLPLVEASADLMKALRKTLQANP